MVKLASNNDEEDHTHYHGVDKAEKHISVVDALRRLLAVITPVKSELIWLKQANTRILSEDVSSPVNMPKLARSTRDGYAVNIINDEESGGRFQIVGVVKIGVVPKISLKSGQAVRIATGAYVPRGANSVVMQEYANVKDKVMTVNREIKIRDNILGAGEDLAKGQIILRGGTKISPQHIALFSMLGIKQVRVFSKPSIAFFSTGDELVDVRHYSKRDGHFIYDANRPFIGSMIEVLGGKPIDLGIAKDQLDKIKMKLLKGLRFDALILSAGSSVGERDYVSKAIETIGEIKSLVHGVAMRPSSPTGLAAYRGKPVILLPGFPTSAIISFLVFARPAILALSGSLNTSPLMIRARLLDEYKGKKGITHFVRVIVRREKNDYVASIVRPTEAYSSRWLQSANGVAVIGKDRGVVKSDAEVEIFLIGEVTETVK